MTGLRLILLGVGCVLIAAIYIVGRMRRSAIGETPSFKRSSADRTSDERIRTSRDFAPELSVDHSQQTDQVPQLDEAVQTRQRPEIVSSRGDRVRLGELPSIHASELPHADPHTSLPDSVSHLGGDIHIRHEPKLGELEQISTGAFIARQAKPIDYKTQAFAVDDEPVSVTSSASRSELTPEDPVTDQPVTPTPTASRLQAESRSRPVRKPASRKIVALRLSAGAQLIEGSRLRSHLESAGLRLGKYSIFHRHEGDDATVFSVASMVEPGTFDPLSMNGIQFPGVTLFAQFPGPLDSDTTFSEMLNCARGLEQNIGGILQDERGLPLTEQREQRLREDISDFVHLLGQSNA